MPIFKITVDGIVMSEFESDLKDINVVHLALRKFKDFNFRLVVEKKYLGLFETIAICKR